MARIAATEDVEGIRDEEDVGGTEESQEEEGNTGTDGEDSEEKVASSPKETTPRTRKYVATTQEVHDAFDSVTVLRYSQPFHLQGKSPFYRRTRYVRRRGTG